MPRLICRAVFNAAIKSANAARYGRFGGFLGFALVVLKTSRAKDVLNDVGGN